MTRVAFRERLPRARGGLRLSPTILHAISCLISEITRLPPSPRARCTVPPSPPAPAPAAAAARSRIRATHREIARFSDHFPSRVSPFVVSLPRYFLSGRALRARKIRRVFPLRASFSRTIFCLRVFGFFRAMRSRLAIRDFANDIS